MNDTTSQANTFRRLCDCDAIAVGGAKGFSVDGFDVFVVRRGDSYYAYLNRCPHLGLPLNWVPDQFLDSDGELIQCSSHGALFIVENGRCVAGPCSGQQLQQLQSKIEGNSLFVALTSTCATNRRS